MIVHVPAFVLIPSTNKIFLNISEAVAKMDDDGIILSVYDSIHDELRAKNKHIEKLKQDVSKAGWIHHPML